MVYLPDRAEGRAVRGWTGWRTSVWSLNPCWQEEDVEDPDGAEKADDATSSGGTVALIA